MLLATDEVILIVHSELVVELGLNPPCRRSQEAQISLPEPPSELGASPGVPSPSNTPEHPTSQQAQGWYFYLSEISLRRMMEDTTRLLHDDGPEGWMRDGISLVTRSRTCEEQIDLWAQSIPSCMFVDSGDDPSPSIDFGHHLKGRVLQWRQMITLPLLYVSVHSLDRSPGACAGASKCIDYTMQRIMSMRGIGRHGGTWFMLRHLFLGAMILCSCRLSPMSYLLPPTWSDALDTALDMLRVWSGQANDIKLMYSLLDSTVSKIREPNAI